MSWPMYSMYTQYTLTFLYCDIAVFLRNVSEDAPRPRKAEQLI